MCNVLHTKNENKCREFSCSLKEVLPVLEAQEDYSNDALFGILRFCRGKRI